MTWISIIKKNKKGNGCNDYLPLFRNNISNTKGRHNSGILKQSKTRANLKVTIMARWDIYIYVYIILKNTA